MTKPEFPIICIDKKYFVELLDSEARMSKVSALALINVPTFQDIFVFDKNGFQWSYKMISTEFKETFFNRILIKAGFYFRTFSATVIWTRVCEYDLAKLKENLVNCVDQDDDILTQFIEPKDLSNAIRDAKTFDDLVTVLKNYVFPADENILFR
jgi:hypothetical protein